MSALPCPECAAGKHPNCDGTSWDEAADAPAPCPCAARRHAPEDAFDRGGVQAGAVVRTGRHTITVEGHSITANASQEARIAAMTAEERSRFLHIMGRR